MDKTITYTALGLVVIVGLFFALTLKGASPGAPIAESPPESAADGYPVSGSAADSSARARPAPGEVVVADLGQTTSSPSAQQRPTPSPSTEPLTLPQLRDLSTSSPLLALRLAREENERDPRGQDAPGRAWVIVKSLTNLERFDEAREEGRRMVSAYPNHPDTLDVERHVLSHPPGPTGTHQD